VALFLQVILVHVNGIYPQGVGGGSAWLEQSFMQILEDAEWLLIVQDHLRLLRQEFTPFASTIDATLPPLCL
jgi:hypothetical protein